jgi:hypothetical protein
MFQEPRERDPNLTQLFTGVVVCIVLMLSSLCLELMSLSTLSGTLLLL